MPFGGKIVQTNVNPKYIFGLCILVVTPLLTISYFTKNFTLFYITYVTGFSINQGFLYMAPIHHLWLWFPNNKGLMSGIALGGYGIGPLMFNTIAGAVLNPNNEQFD